MKKIVILLLLLLLLAVAWFTFKKSTDQKAWQVGTMKRDGKEFIVRCNKQFWKFQNKSEFKYNAQISLHLETTQSNGFPSGEENAKLFDLEDKLIALVTASNSGLFYETITGNGVKEYYFYVQNENFLKLKEKEIQQAVMPYAPTTLIKEDQTWETYRTYCPQ